MVFFLQYADLQLVLTFVTVNGATEVHILTIVLSKLFLRRQKDNFSQRPIAIEKKTRLMSVQICALHFK